MDLGPSPANLADRDLLIEAKRLAHCEREATVVLVAALAEVDARRLYLGAGCSSLFTYRTGVLHLSEHAAYGRIEAARVGRRFPIVLERLAAGDVTLTAVSLLRPHLTEGNCGALLDAARHRTKREVERIVAELAPRPDAAAVVRRLPAPKTVAATFVRAQALVAESPLLSTAQSLPSVAAPTMLGVAVIARVTPPNQESVPTPVRRSAPPVVAPLAPERYKVQFTVSRETHDKLRRAQDLLRHAVPNGDPAEIFDRALTRLLEHLEKTKLGNVKHPRDRHTGSVKSRRIPAAVKRAVWTRDGGRCGFVGSEGRCRETAFLEFHHVVPFARGGPATVENIELRCRAHNQHESGQMVGCRGLLLRETAMMYGGVGIVIPSRPSSGSATLQWQEGEHGLRRIHSTQIAGLGAT